MIPLFRRGYRLLLDFSEVVMRVERARRHNA